LLYRKSTDIDVQDDKAFFILPTPERSINGENLLYISFNANTTPASEALFYLIILFKGR